MPNIPGVADHAADIDRRPQPVLDAAEIAGDVQRLIQGVGAVLVLAGLFTDGTLQKWALALAAAVAVVATFTAKYLPVLRARRAAEKVTPLVSPRDVRGVRLIPVDSYGRRAAAEGNTDPR